MVLLWQRVLRVFNYIIYWLLISTKLFIGKNSINVICHDISCVLLCKILFFGTSSPVPRCRVRRSSFFRSGWYSFTSCVYISPVGSVHVVTVSHVRQCKRTVTAESIAMIERSILFQLENRSIKSKYRVLCEYWSGITKFYFVISNTNLII